MYKRTILIGFMIIICLVAVKCSYYGIQHSVLECSPYVDHSMNDCVMRVNGRSGIAVSLNGYYDRITTDRDTTIEVFNGDIGFRGRFEDIGDVGLGFNTTVVNSKLYGYSVMDGKFYVLDDVVGIYPYIGFGGGMGTYAWSFDIRTALIFRVNIVEEMVAVHAAPRVIGLMYPYYEEVSGGITVSYSYALMPVYGIDAGLDFTIPIQKDDMFITITPDINYLFAREPEGNQDDITVLQAGCSFAITF